VETLEFDNLSVEEQNIVALLESLDTRAARTESAAAQKRESPRQRLRARCDIRFLARDRATVLNTIGRTRDISRTGLGFLCGRHLAKDTPVHVIVHGADGRDFNLYGVVVHSRALRDEWFLVGLKFQKIDNEALVPGEEVRPANEDDQPVDQQDQPADEED